MNKMIATSSSKSSTGKNWKSVQTIKKSNSTGNVVLFSKMKEMIQGEERAPERRHVVSKLAIKA